MVLVLIDSGLWMVGWINGSIKGRVGGGAERTWTE